MSIFDNLEPNLLWKHFNEISKIPRCSKHEERIREYIIDFGKARGLPVKTDDAGNIVISKSAAPGHEEKKIVILQGHMDMVCEKNSDVTHDFSKDPIPLKKEGNILTASGTTLGADNGIGIATGLAILEDTSLLHGPLEVLFTVDEETGLTGAFALQSDMLSGRVMINLDSEDFGVLTVGCAGGGDSKITLPITCEETPDGFMGFRLKVLGLRGGHSGVDIHEQRGNAIKLLSRILWEASQKVSVFLTGISGGDKHNAIPREASAHVLINPHEKDDFLKMVSRIEKEIKEEILPIDPKFEVNVTQGSPPGTMFTLESTKGLINLLHGLPHGVHKKSYDIPDLVETSTNLATVTLNENSVIIGLSSRSSITSALLDMRNRIHALATLSGATVEEEEPYPGWKPNLESPLLALAKKVFQDMFGQVAKVEAIHAGLECGIIGEKFPGMDMISIGPTIKYPHSPEEQVQIDTVEKFFQFVLKILDNI